MAQRCHQGNTAVTAMLIIVGRTSIAVSLAWVRPQVGPQRSCGACRYGGGGLGRARTGGRRRCADGRQDLEDLGSVLDALGGLTGMQHDRVVNTCGRQCAASVLTSHPAGGPNATATSSISTRRSLASVCLAAVPGNATTPQRTARRLSQQCSLNPVQMEAIRGRRNARFRDCPLVYTTEKGCP